MRILLDPPSENEEAGHYADSLESILKSESDDLDRSTLKSYVFIRTSEQISDSREVVCGMCYHPDGAAK